MPPKFVVIKGFVSDISFTFTVTTFTMVAVSAFDATRFPVILTVVPDASVVFIPIDPETKFIPVVDTLAIATRTFPVVMALDATMLPRTVRDAPPATGDVPIPIFETAVIEKVFNDVKLPWVSVMFCAYREFDAYIFPDTNRVVPEEAVVDTPMNPLGAKMLWVFRVVAFARVALIWPVEIAFDAITFP